MSGRSRGVRRRGLEARRLFIFWLAVLLSGGLAPVSGQEVGDARILSREIVLRRESAEEFRVVEVVEMVWPDRQPPDTVSGPELPVLRLPGAVREIQVVGGDVPAQQVTYLAPDVVLLRPPPTGRFRSLITYRVPARPREISFQAHVPVAELSLAVSRSGVDARPGPGLTSLPDEGRERSRFVWYSAQDLARDSALSVRIRDDRVDPRERLAVFLAGCVAAALVLLRVWRSGPGAT